MRRCTRVKRITGVKKIGQTGHHCRDNHHHHAFGRDATKTASIHLTIAHHLSLCCEGDVHESVFMSLSFRFLLMVSLNRGR